MDTYRITPAVDAVREFLEIAGDFTNPLELVREAISNAIDADATEISISFEQPKVVGGYLLIIKIEDNGRGMDEAGLQSFFDLGSSIKRADPTLIGEKGHGTKVYFNCHSINVVTTKDGVTLSAEMETPYKKLHDGTLPQASVQKIGTPGTSSGTKIKIEGFNNNDGELFTHDRLKDYVTWFTKFGSFEGEVGINEHSERVLLMKGLDVKDFEPINFGHSFPKESKPIEELFSEYVVKAPDFYCKKIVKTGTLRKYPSIHFDAIFYIEGNKVKQSHNRMLKRPGHSAPSGAYTVQERYGVWLCKDFIPIERKNEWISTKGSEFTKFHAFFNCQDLSLTANRGSVANTPPAILSDVRGEIERLYEEIISSDYWREMDWLESEADSYLTSEREQKDFKWRQERAQRSNIAFYKNSILVEPTRESGVYALLVQLCTLDPELFPFSIVDYDTHSGIDIIAKSRDNNPTVNSSLYYIELKKFLESSMNHSFENLRYVVCWDSAVKHDSKVVDLSGKERTLSIVPPSKEDGNYTGYFLNSNFKQHIEVFVLKDYLRQTRGIEFRPRTEVEAIG